ILFGTDPTDVDKDGDGLASRMEELYELTYVDYDYDGLLGDNDPDCDGDGILDGYEVKLNLNEYALEEFGSLAYYTMEKPDPTKFDSDGDGLSDGWEFTQWAKFHTLEQESGYAFKELGDLYCPTKAFTFTWWTFNSPERFYVRNDGHIRYDLVNENGEWIWVDDYLLAMEEAGIDVPNGVTYANGECDAFNVDTDADGVPDGVEVYIHATDPTNPEDVAELDVDDYDGDGLTNDEEEDIGTNMFWPDTDCDGLSDGQEVNGITLDNQADRFNDKDGVDPSSLVMERDEIVHVWKNRDSKFWYYDVYSYIDSPGVSARDRLYSSKKSGEEDSYKYDHESMLEADLNGDSVDEFVEFYETGGTWISWMDYYNNYATYKYDIIQSVQDYNGGRLSYQDEDDETLLYLDIDGDAVSEMLHVYKQSDEWKVSVYGIDMSQTNSDYRYYNYADDYLTTIPHQGGEQEYFFTGDMDNNGIDELILASLDDGTWTLTIYSYDQDFKDINSMFVSDDWPIIECDEYSVGDNFFEVGDIDGDGDSEIIQYHESYDSNGEFLLGWVHSYNPDGATPSDRLVDEHGSIRSPYLAYKSKYNKLLSANLDDITIEAGSEITAYAGLPISFPDTTVVQDNTRKVRNYEWTWDFGDESGFYGQGKNPIHVYEYNPEVTYPITYTATVYCSNGHEGGWDTVDVKVDLLKTDPLDFDMDGDLLLDGQEFLGWDIFAPGNRPAMDNVIPIPNYIYDPISNKPTNPDRWAMMVDNDVKFVSSPLAKDSDNDGLKDRIEVDGWLVEIINGNSHRTASNPARYGDNDGDGMDDYQEWEAGTDTRCKDTDGDGFDDGWEIEVGFDP
ncbi:MAG: hypothetical protein ACXQTE_06430, partial [Methanosarcinaceae archaeon]